MEVIRSTSNEMNAALPVPQGLTYCAATATTATTASNCVGSGKGFAIYMTATVSNTMIVGRTTSITGLLFEDMSAEAEASRAAKRSSFGY